MQIAANGTSFGLRVSASPIASNACSPWPDATLVASSPSVRWRRSLTTRSDVSSTDMKIPVIAPATSRIGLYEKVK